MVRFVQFAAIFVPILYLCDGGAAKTKKARLSIVSVEPCKLVSKRVDSEHEVKYSVQARKVSRETTLVKTSFNVPKKFGPISFSLAGYQLQQSNARNLVLKLDSMKCRDMIPLAFTKILTLQFDKDCHILPHLYEVDSIDAQDYASIFAKAIKETGKYAVDFEFWSPKGVVACVSLTVNFIAG